MPDRLPGRGSQRELPEAVLVRSEQHQDDRGRHGCGHDPGGEAKPTQLAHAAASAAAATGGAAERAVDAAEQEQLPLAVVAGRHVGKQLWLVTVGE
jgi:hypothetical protein